MEKFTGEEWRVITRLYEHMQINDTQSNCQGTATLATSSKISNSKPPVLLLFLACIDTVYAYYSSSCCCANCCGNSTAKLKLKQGLNVKCDKTVGFFFLAINPKKSIFFECLKDWDGAKF